MNKYASIRDHKYKAKNVGWTWSEVTITWLCYIYSKFFFFPLQFSKGNNYPLG